MPTLSFIRAPKAPKWIPKVPSRTSPAGRVDPASISSPHPYASPDIIDIHDRATTESTDEGTVSEKRSVQASPHVRLNLDLTSEPFDSDWFQTRFTSTPSPSRQSPSGQRRSRIVASESQALGSAGRWKPPQSVPVEAQNDNYDDDIDLSTSEDDVLDHLKSMDASTFLKLPSQPSHLSQSNETIEPAMPRRNPPTPIKIPSLSMHGAQVQIVRSAEANSSRPLSEISSTDSSAVSGQTLARALLGNSFVLSTDNRSSRYRSGLGGLARSDSATLPRGDHPLMNSPHSRDRTLSGTSDTFATDLNAPPVPSNAERVYVPPQTPRHSGTETKRKANFKRRSSTGSLVSPTSKSDYTHSRPNSVTEFAAEIDRDILAIRRISRISEAPSSTSTNPANPDISPRSPSPEYSPTEPSPVSPDPSTPPVALTPPLATSSSNHVSPAPSSSTLVSSTKELENVLDYYSSSEKPEKPFAPTFSPIAEESSSQLSSPASRRLSTSTASKGQTVSPLSGTTNGRIDLSTVRRPSDGAIIGRISSSRRRSSQISSPDLNHALPTPPQTGQGINSYGGVKSQRTSLAPARPSGTVIGGRLRSGSAPSPIKITRDSRDLSSYKIISPLPENALGTPSTAGSSDGMATQQTFPETPNAFSPFWSPGSMNSPGMIQRLPEGYDVSAIPYTPLSAALPLQERHMPSSLSQQVVLTRASSLVDHSRQGSGTRSGASTRGPAVPSTPEVEEDEAANDGADDTGQEVVVPTNKPTELSPGSSASRYSEQSDELPSRYAEAGAATVGFTSMTDQISPSTIGSSPILGYLGHDPSPPSTHTSPSANAFSPANPSQSHKFGFPPEFTDPFDSQSRTHSSPRFNPRTYTTSPGGRSLQTPPPVVVTPPAVESALVPSPYAGHSLRPISEISHNFESPPPYDTIDHDRPPPISIAPSSSSSADIHTTNSGMQSSQQTQHNSGNEYSSMTRKNSISNQNRRGRMRPTGPRRPVSHINNPTARNRMPSDASVGSTGAASATSTPRNPMSTPNIESQTLTIYPQSPDPQSDTHPSPSGTTIAVNTAAAPSPKTPSFNVPAMPYRGLTMDQAKWTFTSSQLQTIVSRAIRQSAEASSIRLLRLETLDHEIPQEVERFENRKTEIKAKYRTLTRTSEALYSKIDSQISVGSSNVQTTLEELRDTTRQLNKLTEELHCVDQQHAQVMNLVQLHSASALSMALRKLNASFLKQLTQTQELQREVSDLRDDLSVSEMRSMKLAQENQLLQLQSAPQSSTSGPETGLESNSASSPTGDAPVLGRKRSAPAAIARKPSLVQFPRSTARWSGNRASQRSSLSSTGNRLSVGGASGTNAIFGVPPVPPLPRRRPTDIVTDGPPTRSATLLSTETPNTEVRAMIRAQDELYRMLGISLADRRMRRSHSIIGLPGNPEMQPHPSTTSTTFRQPTARVSGVSRNGSLDSDSVSTRVDTRPQSYPASLLEAYSALDADRNAMLATLDLLSQDEH